MSNEAAVLNAPAKKKKKTRKTKNLIIAGIVLAALAAGGFLLWKFIFAKDNEKGAILTDTAMRGTIQSMVEGYGNTKPKDSAAITLAAGGTVVDVYVKEGDYVFEGQELYRISSAAAEEAVYNANQTLTNRVKELDELYRQLGELTVRAPFAGQIQNADEFELGQTVSKGTRVATLVDNSTLKLSLYFSYAYEGEIHAGQTVQISIPASMSTLSGKVEQVNYVRRVSPEGSVLFEAVVTAENPGTLTEGMTASAVLTGGDGSVIYPYAAAELAYYRTVDITAKAGGSVEARHLLNYADVRAGDVLLVLGADETDSLIRSKQKEVDAAQEELDKAQKALNNFNAMSPINGTVISCALQPGQEVSSGATVITISDTSVMTVEIQVDERNVAFVKPGMPINLDQWGNIYTGVVESVSLEGTAQQGMSTFPAVVKVENPDGQLMSGMYVTYSFVASQSDDCLMIPIQCVRYINDESGTPATVVFLQADSRPDHAVTLNEEAQADLPDGFYAVAVSTGLSDVYNIEITEGLDDGDVVFTNYETNQGDSYGRWY